MGFSLVYRTMGLVNFAHGNVVMIGAYLASTFYLSAKLPFALAMVVAIAVTGADRRGHRAGAAAAGEQGLRPDADRHDRLRHRAGGAGDPHLGRHRPGGALAGAGRAAGRVRRCGSAPTTWSCSPSPRSRPSLLVLLPAAHQARRRDAGRRDGPRGGHRGRHPRRAQQRDRVHASAPAWPRSPAAWSARCSTSARRWAARWASRASPRAILGGFGSIPGAIVGGLAIGVLDSFAAGHFQGYSELVTFLVFTVIIMIRPTGIFGERTVNRA